MYLRIGDVLVKQGLLTAAQRDAVLEEQRLTGRPFGLLAERLYGLSPASVEAAWAEQYCSIAETIDPRNAEVDPYALRMVNRRQAWQFRVLPIRFDGDELVVCTAGELLPRAARFVSWRVGHPCYLVVATAADLDEALARFYPLSGAESIPTQRIAKAG